MIKTNLNKNIIYILFKKALLNTLIKKLANPQIS